MDAQCAVSIKGRQPAIFGVNQLVEAVIEHARSSGNLELQASFDEFNPRAANLIPHLANAPVKNPHRQPHAHRRDGRQRPDLQRGGNIGSAVR